jgi:prophage regulatory protein
MPKLLTFEELKSHGVLLGRRQIDRLEADDKFPKRVPISTWRVGWVADEVDQWIADKIAARRTGVGALGTGEGRVRRRLAAAS